MNKVFLLALLFSTSTMAAEVDHYTDKGQPLEDMAIVINEMANEYLVKGLKKENESGSCNNSKKSEKALYKTLRKYFANHSKGELVIEILHDDEVVKRKSSLIRSVYRDWSVFNGLILGYPGAKNSPLALSPLMRVGEYEIGVDKLEHMFGMGFRYFNQFYLKKKKLRKVLKKGIVKEKTILGGMPLATGVFSYADLSANFNGMRFWNHMLLKRDDVLGKEYNLGPYVKCENNKWVANEEKSIDFRDYIDISMDETVNCSKFATKSGLRKFKKELKKLGDYSCPVDSSIMQEMMAKYSTKTHGDKKNRPISHWIINDEGHKKVSYTNEF